jgi:hypothetical protein
MPINAGFDVLINEGRIYNSGPKTTRKLLLFPANQLGSGSVSL